MRIAGIYISTGTGGVNPSAMNTPKMLAARLAGMFQSIAAQSGDGVIRQKAHFARVLFGNGHPIIDVASFKSMNRAWFAPCIEYLKAIDPIQSQELKDLLDEVFLYLLESLTRKLELEIRMIEFGINGWDRIRLLFLIWYAAIIWWFLF